MMRICALALLLAAAANAQKSEWSQLIKNADSRSDWVPVHPPRDLDVAAQEEVSTILRPPSEPGFVRQTRLIQPPRQERTNFGPPPQPYFPGDQSHLIRFPGQQAIPLRGGPLPNGPPPNFIPNFRPQQSQPPQGFLQQPPVPQPQQQRFVNQQQQQSQQQFVNQQPIPLRPQNQSFVPAGPQDEVQLVYVPIEALPPFQKPSNNVPVKQKAPQQLPPPGQFGRQPQPLPFGNQQQQFDQEQLRIARLKEQEERQRIQEQELRERQEQEKRIRQEAEQKQQQQRPQQQQFRPPQNFGPTNLKTQENIFQQRFPQTTELPTNPAPHQPPLAVYVTAGSPQKMTVDDVIASLKDATTIPVLDTLPDPKSPPPQIFVGPAEMPAPNGYSKFDLPYLNSLDTNRVERKVEQLPFFVAPLSYNPPQGYNKIPFPAPHVGSVVVAPGARHFNARPASPDPISQNEQYAVNEEPQISPAIPLLVNSLQNGGQRQKFHHQQQQQQVISPPPQPQHLQRFPTPPPQHVQPQFIYRDEQTFAPPPPPPQPAFVRQHHRHQPQQHQQQQLPHVEQFLHEVPPAHQFAPQQPQFIREPFQNQPQFIPNNQFQFTEESAEIPEEPQIENEVPTEAPTTTTTTTPETPRPVTRVRSRPQAVSTTAAPRTRAPSRQSDENVERRPVNRGRRPVHRERTTTPEPEVEEQTEQQFLDVPRENSVRHEIPAPNYPLPPSQISPFTNQQHFAQIPLRHQQFDAKPQFPAFQGQFEHNFRSLPAPTPQIGVTYVNNGAPENHRTVFSDQPAHGVSPSTINYPTASPSLEPQLSLKGEIGQVQHFASPTPFAPTPLPQEVSPHAFTSSPSFAPALVETEAPSTPESIPEVSTTEEPQRTRQRIPAAENVAINSTPRPRTRVTAEGQRFRARPTANKDENQDENTPQQTPQRTRGRQVVRVRTTTEGPVAEGENYPEREVSRPRNRFRAIDRTRVGARQQQVVRSRQPVAQNQEDIELTKPVRNGPSTERIINDSPVFLSENDAEGEVSTEKSTTEAAATQKPGRRFNNFGVGQRTRRIRPVANQEQAESPATTVAPSRSFTTARSSRRQSTPAPISRSTLRGGARLRKPTTTTEAPEAEEAASVETGVTYVKSPYVSIQRGENPAEEASVEEVAAPALPQKAVKSSHVEQFHRQSVTPAYQQENYPANYNFDEAQPETVVYRPRVRVPSRNRYHQQEDPEFNVEESQRSEQISIQQLDDAVNILKSYYNTKYSEDEPIEGEEIIDFTEEPNTESAFVAEAVAEQSTEQKVEAATTEPVPTTIAEEVSEVATSSTEEPKVEKFSAKIKVSEPKRRIRIKKRPVGDVFETAESQNIATAKNTFSKSTEKKSEESKLFSTDLKGPKVEESSEHKELESVHFTSTTTTTTTTEAPVTTTPEVAETATAKSATETTPSIPDELTTLENTATTTGDEEVTTEPATIIIGTSTTTEISLETEICYKGRCIKTKVDADQMPIE